MLITDMAGYIPKNGEIHRSKAFEFYDLDQSDCTLYFKQNGVRWFELARLLYFDAPKMTIIDPMHNILLGKLIYRFRFILVN